MKLLVTIINHWEEQIKIQKKSINLLLCIETIEITSVTYRVSFLFQIDHNLCCVASPRERVEYLFHDLLQNAEQNFDNVYAYFELLNFFIPTIVDKTISSCYVSLMYRKALFRDPSFKKMVIDKIVLMTDL